jgi:hypothetical protein
MLAHCFLISQTKCGPTPKQNFIFEEHVFISVVPDGQQKNHSQYPAGERDFYLLQIVQTGSGTHTGSHKIATLSKAARS